MLAAEVPLHYLVNVASPEFTAAVEQGIADARAWCREQGIPLASARRQGQDLMALTFRETMQGPFALGETDPEEGRKKGLAAGHLACPARQHPHRCVRPLRQRAEPRRRADRHRRFRRRSVRQGHGRVQGRVQSVQAGRQGQGTGLKHFVYEMAFEHDGKPYYLAGRKDVREGGDLWNDTTTLYTRLHEGSDASGKVIGAGVLTPRRRRPRGPAQHRRGPQRRQRAGAAGAS